MHTIQRFAGAVLTTLLLVTAFLTVSTPPAAQAATWNTALGMGNPSDEWTFSGSGAFQGTVGNNRSNSLYYITSAKSSGSPRFTSLNFWTDATRPFAEVWVATNTWTCASNQPAGTNVLWLTTTNLSMTTNDVLVLRDVGNDCYQFITLNTKTGTDGSGLINTNAAGHNAITVLSVPTNTITAGDILYKMARVQVINPTLWLNSDNGTNFLNATKTNFYVLPVGKSVNGPLGLPMMVSIFATNPAACWLNVAGEYYARPRR